MKFYWGKAIITFIVGFIISFIIGSFFGDGGAMAAVAVCYVGAIIVGIFGKNN